jgi:sugar phosphate isomerase/epimerase
MLANFAAAVLPGQESARPTLIAETYIWLLEAQVRQRRPVEIVNEAFATSRDAGFRKVEIMSAFLEPEVRAKTLAALAKSGVEPTIVYVSGPIHDRRAAATTIQRTLEFARIGQSAGARWVNFSTTEKRRARKSDEELASEADSLNRLGRELQKLGLGLLVHHHIPEMRDDAREW